MLIFAKIHFRENIFCLTRDKLPSFESRILVSSRLCAPLSETITVSLNKGSESVQRYIWNGSWLECFPDSSSAFLTFLFVVDLKSDGNLRTVKFFVAEISDVDKSFSRRFGIHLDSLHGDCVYFILCFLFHTTSKKETVSSQFRQYDLQYDVRTWSGLRPSRIPHEPCNV